MDIHKYSNTWQSKLENLNVTTPDGWIPINLAARYGNTEIFKLLAPKVDFNVVAPNGGYAPIHYAAMYGYPN